MSSVFAGTMVARFLGHRGIAVFSILSLVIAFVSSAIIWVEVVLGSCEVWLDLGGVWFEVGSVQVSWSLYYDLLTAHMLFTVTSVSLAVHLFAVVYMRSDPHLTLFMSYLSLFTFFMLVLVTGDNLVMMLVGWEGYFYHSLSDYSSFSLDMFASNALSLCLTNVKGDAFPQPRLIDSTLLAAHLCAANRVPSISLCCLKPLLKPTRQ